MEFVVNTSWSESIQNNPSIATMASTPGLQLISACHLRTQLLTTVCRTWLSLSSLPKSILKHTPRTVQDKSCQILEYTCVCNRLLFNTSKYNKMHYGIPLSNLLDRVYSCRETCSLETRNSVMLSRLWIDVSLLVVAGRQRSCFQEQRLSDCYDGIVLTFILITATACKAGSLRSILLYWCTWPLYIFQDI